MGILRFFGDGLANLVSGAGTTADKRVHGFYHQQHTSPQQIEAAYRSSFLMRKAVDLIPFDMTRAGRDWQCEGGDIAKIEAEEKRLQVWAKLQQALILGRLGGGLIVMGIGRENPAMPVNPRSLAAGSLRYLHVMNRWQVATGEIITDPTDDHFGQPAYFQINGDGGRQVRIHPSRVICFKGRMVPGLHAASGDDLFWGDSEVAGLLDPVKNADAAMNGFASLIDEAKVDTVSIPGLTQTLATTEGEALVLKRVSVANTMKSMHNTRILDGGNGQTGSGEEWDTRQVAWAGMPEMIRTYIALVATAADVPATRFIGKSPDGMNATGDGDEANHQTMIRARQEQTLRPQLDRLDAALLPSAGVTPSDDTWYRFAPLSEMGEKEAADTFKVKMEAIEKLQNTGAIPEVAFIKAVQNTAVEENWLPGLDGALAELPENERFGLSPDADEADDDDPSALTEPKRIAANDGKGGGRQAEPPFADARLYRRDKRGRFASSSGSAASIRSFVQRVMAAPGEHLSLDIGKVAGKSPEHIHGFSRRVQSGPVAHALKEHGDPQREAARGQKRLTRADIARAPQVVDEAHTVRVHGAAGRNRPQSISYTARIGRDEVTYVETVGLKTQQVVFKTMWKR